MFSKPVDALRVLLFLSLATLVDCGGGGGSQSSLPRTPLPGATKSAANTATLAFRIAIPARGTTQSSTVRSGSPKRFFIAPSSQSLTISITDAQSHILPNVTAPRQCDAGGQNCYFQVNASLAVANGPYTFGFADIGTSGKKISGLTIVQGLVAGANTVNATLLPTPDHATLTINGSLNYSGTAIASLPVSTSVFDADGNAIPNGLTYDQGLDINLTESDNVLSAFTISAVAGTNATCSAPTLCTLTSGADAVTLNFNPAAGAYPAEPSYYPVEAILNDETHNVGLPVTTANSTSISTKCTPTPICVYAPLNYPSVLASGVPTSLSPFTPLEAISVGSAIGSTVYTDYGTVTGAGTTSYAFNNLSGDPTQSIAGLQYVAATGSVYTVDYSGSQNVIDTMSTAGVISPTPYTPDPNTLNGVGTSAQIVLGGDGDLWWIDPITGVLRYSAPNAFGSVGSCTLNPKSNNLFLTAYSLAATPAGVSPARIWFSAFDAINTNNTYIGYVSIAPGSNSCGTGQLGHYAQIAKDNVGTNSVPNGMAVDGTGNLWYNSSDSSANGGNGDYTSIGEALVSGTTLALVRPIQLPGAMGQVSGQAWDIVYDSADGYLYTAVDTGFIGRFSPSAGVATATAYTLPLPLAMQFVDVTSNPDYNGFDGASANCFTYSGGCFPQFSWDPGSGGAHGRLTFVTNANAPAQLDLDYPGVSFAATNRQILPRGFRFAASRRSSRTHARYPRARLRSTSSLFAWP